MATFLAAAAAAFSMAQATSVDPDAPRATTVADVRALEQPGKLLDATVELPESVRDSIGFDADAPTSEAEIAGFVRKTVAQDAPWSRQMHFIGTAIALGFGDLTTARALLTDLPPLKSDTGGSSSADTDKAPSPLGLEADLTRLAKGEPSKDWDSLERLLVAEAASHWLVSRVRHRHLSNAGDHPAAAAAVKDARARATAWVNLNLAHNLTYGGLVLAGFLILISWPLLKRVVARVRDRHHPLPPAPPFRSDSVQRVVVWWFLIRMLLLQLMVGFQLIDFSSPSNFVIYATGVSLLDGIIALALIQRWGRLEADESPVAMPLRLHTRHVTGGRWSLPLWMGSGLAVCLFFATAGFVINLLLFGAASETQTPVLVLEQLSAPLDIVLAITGICIVAPIVEEVLFRGFVYQAIRGWTGPLLAMLLSGLLFGLLHLQPGNILPLAALGAGLAFVYEWSGSLWVPIAVHALFNLMTVLRTLTMAGV